MSDQARGKNGSTTLTLQREPDASTQSPAGEADAEAQATSEAAKARAPVDGDGAAAQDPRATAAHAWALRLRTLADRLARLIVALTLAITAIVAVGIVFTVLGANTHKLIVSTVQDLAKALASPFDQMFTPHSAKLAVAVNWGIAICVYALVGRVLSRLVTRVAGSPRRAPGR
jgi:hypothetical protein